MSAVEEQPVASAISSEYIYTLSKDLNTRIIKWTRTKLKQDIENSIIISFTRHSTWHGFHEIHENINILLLIYPLQIIDWSSISTGSFKDTCVSLIEFAEIAEMEMIVVGISKDLQNLTTLMRNFLFLGFELVLPSLIPDRPYLYDKVLVGFSL